ncbi:PH domain-containing protein [Sediminibacterium sp.]|uniref:PH domain-containing protein n=1 Tax=Sediminibacterium sp. TaxID=1917865 RepID=UPI0025F0857A|nr:PH domain-containing protein [Sediminibacterium sp.]
MSTNKFDWSVPQKLSPVALLLILGKILKDSWPLLLIIVGRMIINNQEESKRNSSVGLFFVLGISVLILLVHFSQLINFFLFRISVQSGELIVNSGFLSKSKTIIPINRIQSIHVIESYLHKLTNTCELKIETAGTDATEIEIKAIGKEKAQLLQELLQHKVEASNLTNSLDQVQIMSIQFRDLLKLAISENHIKTFLIILAFAYSRLEDVKQIFGADTSKMLDQQLDQADLSESGILTLLIVGFFITLWVSFIRVILRYHEMSVTSNKKGFQMEWGFLQTQQKRLTQNKVQLISWNSNFLRKILGIRILRFFMAGEDLVKIKQHIQLPIMHAHLLYQLALPYQAVWPSSNTESKMVHASFGWRNTIFFAVPIAVVSAFPFYLWNPWFIFFPVLVLLYLAISNWVKYQKFTYWFSETSIQIKKGIWGEENVLLNFNKVQHVMIKSSPFQRHRNLVTVELHTAGETVIIPYITIEQAQYLADLALLNVEFL